MQGRFDVDNDNVSQLSDGADTLQGKSRKLFQHVIGKDYCGEMEPERQLGQLRPYHLQPQV
jgi:X-X-X-Leu-X-X-Gly heptad repeat protein